MNTWGRLFSITNAKIGVSMATKSIKYRKILSLKILLSGTASESTAIELIAAIKISKPIVALRLFILPPRLSE